MPVIVKRLCLIWIFAALPGAALAGDYAQSWGPPVGAAAPAILAEDQDGVTRDLTSLAGENGLLLVLSRSADW
ncbi:MAG: hypothetical protein OXP09_20965 [Gammaproteobacteria bacterium]|nr:hypothetical protein [Gammaproteobacteria bacterium]